MSNASKAKGTRAESAVVRYLESRGIHAERRALHGAKDPGDILVEGHIVLEVKAGKQTVGYGRTLKEQWLNQTRVETANASLNSGYLIIVRYHYPIKDAEVWSMDGKLFWYLDAWCGEIVERNKKNAEHQETSELGG